MCFLIQFNLTYAYHFFDLGKIKPTKNPSPQEKCKTKIRNETIGTNLKLLFDVLLITVSKFNIKYNPSTAKINTGLIIEDAINIRSDNRVTTNAGGII